MCYVNVSPVMMPPHRIVIQLLSFPQLYSRVLQLIVFCSFVFNRSTANAKLTKLATR